jgi:hypothetical protein
MPWEVMPDLFFYREEAEKEAAREEAIVASKQADFVAPPAKEEWGGDEAVAAPVSDWSADSAPAAAAPAAGAPAAAAAAPIAQPAFQVHHQLLPPLKVLSMPWLLRGLGSN